MYLLFPLLWQYGAASVDESSSSGCCSSSAAATSESSTAAAVAASARATAFDALFRSEREGDDDGSVVGGLRKVRGTPAPRHKRRVEKTIASGHNRGENSRSGNNAKL